MTRIVRGVSLLAVLLLFAGCASTRTKYQPMDESGGYAEKVIDNKTMMSRFAGNAFTNANDAMVLSQFRAVELCRDKGFVGARVLGFQDLSTSQTVQRSSTSTSSTPVKVRGNRSSTGTANCYAGSCYGSGTSNYSATATGGDQSSQTRTWNETYHYPTFDTYFRCANESHRLGANIIPISADDMKPYVQDLMGAVQVQGLSDDSPNKEVLQVGDFITKVDGTRVQNNAQLISAVEDAKSKNKIKVRIVREGKAQTVVISAINATDSFKEENQKLVTSICSNASEVRDRPLCAGAGRVPASK
jgi:hypothetical protein